MNTFNKKRIVMITVWIILVIGVLLLYFLFYVPETKELQHLKSSLAEEQNRLAGLENQDVSGNQEHVTSPFTLLKKIPDNPAEEQLVLDIEEAETLSGCLVLNMSVDDEDVQLNEQTAGSDMGVQPSESNAMKTEIALPEGLEQVRIEVQFVSPHYDALKKFLEELENGNRIVHLESIEFDGPPEVSAIDKAGETIKSKISFSAFYYPDAAASYDKEPYFDVPEAADKTNPFAQ